MKGPARRLSLATLAETGAHLTFSFLPAFIFKCHRLFISLPLVYCLPPIPESCFMSAASCSLLFSVSGTELALGKELLSD